MIAKSLDDRFAPNERTFQIHHYANWPTVLILAGRNDNEFADLATRDAMSRILRRRDFRCKWEINAHDCRRDK